MTDYERREAIRQVIVDDGGDGSDIAVKQILKHVQGDAIEIKVNPAVFGHVLSTLKQSRRTIAKRMLVPEWRLEDWAENGGEIEMWRLKIMGSLSRRYNWLVFLLDDPTKIYNYKPKTLEKS